MEFSATVLQNPFDRAKHLRMPDCRRSRRQTRRPVSLDDQLLFAHRCTSSANRMTMQSRIFINSREKTCSRKQARTMFEIHKPTFNAAAFLASAGLGRRIVQVAPKEAFF